jgi:two-component sensor histidine kinase/PAS domain-containing protein
VANEKDSLPRNVRESVRDVSRRKVLSALEVLDTADDPDFDRLTRLAASIFNAPVALVTLVDADRQWFRSSVGIRVRETPVSMSFCAHSIADKAQNSLVILDATQDPRFADNPLVTGEEHVRFYAGVPITVYGERLGSLCVLDRVPHKSVEPRLMEQLADLAGVASSLFELKDEARVRARTAAELIKEEWRHALTLEAGKVGSWVWDIKTGEVVANDILRRMFGIDPVKAIQASDIFSAIEDSDRSSVDAALEATFEDGVDYASEFRVVSGRWLIGRGRVYQRDAAGKPLIMMGVNIDITEARASADHTRHLLRELNHRVKNTLAMIQSLARQTLRQTPQPQAFIDAFSGRLRTLSDAHALLADRDWSGIGLVELIQSQVGPYVITAADRLVLEGKDLRLPPDHALGLGLILHELASNAARFGALSTSRGSVTVSWVEQGGEQPRVELHWKEAGGPKVTKPGETGFGSRLIQRSLDKVLDSSVRLDFPPEGAEAVISFPLD